MTSETALSAEALEVHRWVCERARFAPTGTFGLDLAEKLATLDAARSQPAAEGLDVGRLRSNVLRLRSWDVAKGWYLFDAIVAEFEDILVATEPSR